MYLVWLAGLAVWCKCQGQGRAGGGGGVARLDPGLGHPATYSDTFLTVSRQFEEVARFYT